MVAAAIDVPQKREGEKGEARSSKDVLYDTWTYKGKELYIEPTMILKDGPHRVNIFYDICFLDIETVVSTAY